MPKHEYFNVAGVTYNNDDGVSRQLIVADMDEEDELYLILDPENAFDKDAIAVMWNDDMVGFVPRKERDRIGKSRIIAARDVRVHKIDTMKSGQKYVRVRMEVDAT